MPLHVWTILQNFLWVIGNFWHKRIVVRMRQNAAKTMEIWTTSECNNLNRVIDVMTRRKCSHAWNKRCYLNNLSRRKGRCEVASARWEVCWWMSTNWEEMWRKKQVWGKRRFDRHEHKFLTPQLWCLYNGNFGLFCWTFFRWYETSDTNMLLFACERISHAAKTVKIWTTSHCSNLRRKLLKQPDACADTHGIKSRHLNNPCGRRGRCEVVSARQEVYWWMSTNWEGSE